MYDRIVNAVLAEPWAILPEKLEAIKGLLRLRAAGGTVNDADVQAVGAGPRPKLASQGSVAVLPLFGVIAHRMNVMTEFSGGTSTEQFGKEFRALVADPQIAAIVLDVDSPGGSVSGVPELAAVVREARGTKPIIAVADTLMASAAYWIASQADEIVVTPSGLVGSIGVYDAHEDWSKALEEDGIKVTLIAAGKYKVEGNPFEPLTGEAKAAMQALVDAFYDRFVADVAKGRSTDGRRVTAAQVRAGYGEGRVLDAAAALEANLVDRIDTLEATIARAARGNSSSRARAAHDVTPAEADKPPAPLTDDIAVVDDGDAASDPTLRAFELRRRRR